MADALDALQAKLRPALEANRPDSAIPHVLVALPSYSVSESLLSHYGNRIPSLEHRYLNAILVAGRIPSCDFVYIATRGPQPEVLDYYLSALPAERRDSTRRRIHIVEVADGGLTPPAAPLG